MQATISSQSLQRAGLRAIALIRERTLRGIDANDKPFAPYSTKTFALPLGALNKKSTTALDRAGALEIFTTKSKTKWALVTGGYAAIRNAAGKSSDVNLSWRGSMLRGLTLLSVNGNTVQIGFTDSASAELAYYHNVAGAGKRRVKREFLGLSPSDLSDTVFQRLISEGVVLT